MAYTETTTTGYGTRVGRSFKGIASGFLLFVAGTVLLWWNEGRAVKTDKMLNDAQKACVEMPNPEKIDPALDGELVCGSALVATDDVLTDQDFGISENAIGLTRRVEYFQWVENAKEEKEDKLGGKEVTTTTYTYSQEWVSSPVNSADFKDPAYQNKNYTWTQAENQDLYAENVSFGAYKLTESLIHSISSKEAVELNLNPEQLQAWDKVIGETYARAKGLQTDVNNITTQVNAADAAAIADSAKTVVPDSISQNNKIDLNYVHQMGNVLYYGRNASVPEVGDVRITFEKIVPAKVTVIAQVTGDTFKAFKTSNGKKYQTLVMGKKDADEIFDAEHEANNMWLWVLRIIGTLVVIGGLKGIFGFVETILKVVPFLSSIFAFGVGLICTIVGIVWSLLIIAIAWLFYRPVLGISLLVLAGFLIWVFAFNGKKKLAELANRGKAAPEVAPAAPAEAAPSAPAE
ncbi:MAG: TMEM43 family protein [Bacteroidaceae bacterium]|nr:TMEM43 family protein [Bacteroidaceae bacterium]